MMTNNILWMSRIGPYPKLHREISEIPKISYSQVSNEKISYIRGQLAAKEEIKYQTPNISRLPRFK